MLRMRFWMRVRLVWALLALPLLLAGCSGLPPGPWIVAEPGLAGGTPAAPAAAPSAPAVNPAVSVGMMHNCVLDAEGVVKCWGTSMDGELGVPGAMVQTDAVAVQGLPSGITGVAAGGGFTCAVAADGRLLCWGAGLPAVEGVEPAADATPAAVEGLAGVTTVSAAAMSPSGPICAVAQAGRAFCWGVNPFGQLGDGTTITRTAPVAVTGITSPVTAISSGPLHTCAVTAAGQVLCWGSNEGGQLGDGTMITRTAPVSVVGLESGYQAVSVGYMYSCALSTQGGVKCWGSNEGGILGDGTNINRTTPVDVVGLTSGVRAIATGLMLSCALTTEGGVLCWGMDGMGGEGSKAPQPVAGLEQGVQAIGVGVGNACALLDSGRVRCWGQALLCAFAPMPGLCFNEPYEVGGFGDVATSRVVASGDEAAGATAAPQAESAPAPRAPVHVTAIAAGGGHTCALTEEGGVVCWGVRYYGQLDDPKVAYGNVDLFDVTGLQGVTAISTGLRHTCALTQSGAVYCWGSNDAGQLGAGTDTTSDVPVAVPDLNDGAGMSAGAYHTCAWTVAGDVSCWGGNGSGQLGDGTTLTRTTPVAVVGLPRPVVAVSTGVLHTCALTEGGGVLCWGDNSVQQLGSGALLSSTTPITVEGLGSGVLAIASGFWHTCALTAAGGVKCWGSHGYSQLGDGSNSDSLTPVAVAGLERGVRAIAAGGTHTCVLKETGAVFCWGDNADGQLGNGNNVPSSTPIQVKDLAGSVVALSAGNRHTCVLLETGDMQCWGWNGGGQLGDGTTNNQAVPITVHGIGTVEAAPRAPISTLMQATGLSAGAFHTCAMTQDGGLRCWGFNDAGMLGDGTTISRAAPVAVGGLTGQVAAVATRGYHTCALTASGEMLCWGDNESGQLGDGTTINRTTPVTVTGITSVTAIATGVSHTCAVTRDSGVYCWGFNENGQVGDGTFVTRTVQVAVGGLAGPVTALAPGGRHTCALLASGRVQCWGYNGDGQLGNGTHVTSTVPVTVTGLSGVTALRTGRRHMCALTDGGEVLCWGGNAYGQLGDGATISRTTPVTVGGLESVTDIATGNTHTCALTAQGRVFCWGNNDENQLGDNTFTNSLTPVAVQGLADGVVALTAGYYHTCALLDTGGVQCWGYNLEGEAGAGTNDRSTPPVDVSGFGGGEAPSGEAPSGAASSSEAATDAQPASGPGGPFTAIASGGRHMCAVTAAGGVRCQGFNGSGQLGNGAFEQHGGLSGMEGFMGPADTTDLVAVTGLEGRVQSIALGAFSTCALLDTGGVQCWGRNAVGQLGDGSTISRTAPVTVTGLISGVTALAVGDSHACAVTTAGAIRCWGRNQAGQLGDGTMTDRLTPVAGPTLPAVTAIGGGYGHTCALLKSSGVVCWGENKYGQLGDGSNTDSLTPVAVAGLDQGVRSLLVGNSHNCVLLATGGVQCWGYNSDGQLGDGSTGDRNTPVDVIGLERGVAAVAVGLGHTCALLESGAVKCWGYNELSQVGPMAMMLSANPKPIEVTGFRGRVVALSAGGFHTCALLEDGSVQCWGALE